MIIRVPLFSIDREGQRHGAIHGNIPRINTASENGKDKSENRLANQLTISWHNPVRCLLIRLSWMDSDCRADTQYEFSAKMSLKLFAKGDHFQLSTCPSQHEKIACLVCRQAACFWEGTFTQPNKTCGCMTVTSV